MPLAEIFARTIADRVEISSEAADELGRVLVACEVPAQMVGFIHFAGQLAKLLPSLQERVSLKHPLELTRSLSLIAALASTAADTLPLLWRRVPNTGGGEVQSQFARTLGGYYKTHPIYCAIWHGCVDSIFIDNFYALCAEVIVAGYELRVIDANNAVAASRRYEMGLLLRRLGTGDTAATQALLSDLPKPTMTGRDYADELDVAWIRFKSNQPAESVVRLGPLVDLLARAVDKVAAQKRERKTVGGGRRGATVGLRAEHFTSDAVTSFDAFEEYDPTGKPDGEARLETANSKQRPSERVTTFSGRTLAVTADDIEGESAGETRSAASVIRIASRRPADADDRLALLRLRGRLAAIAMQKQNLRTQWRGLTERECALFVSAIPKLVNRASSVNAALGGAIRVECEAFIFMALLFMTGFPPEQVGRARVSGKGSSGSLVEAPLWIDRQWRTLTIQVVSPQSRDRARGSTNQDAENIEEKISLGVPTWLYMLARSAIPKDYGTSRSIAQPLFRSTLPELLSVAQQELVSINRNMGTRITLDRLSRHRALSVTRFAAGDEADAMFATWDQQWQRHNGPYYYARPTHQLVEILNNSLVNDFTEWYGTVSTDATLGRQDAKPTVSLVGSHYCPKTSTVRSMIRGLQDRIRESVTRQSAATIPEVHRRYATYVQAFYATLLASEAFPIHFDSKPQ